MPQSRQLAAIMFTDIVGYTAMMGEDEQKAFEILKKNRQLQKPLIEQHNGRWIKELGDGVLASFNTVSDAVNAAVKIQEICNKTKVFSLRIGIHHGEVVFEQDDIFGDAVNIASRIQTLGVPGSILFSRNVNDEIKNKSEFYTVSLGSFDFKNVKESMEVFALANEGLIVPKREQMSGKLKQDISKRKKSARKNVAILASVLILLIAGIFFYVKYFNPQINSVEKSIAILPFRNMSNDPQQEYFAEGMMDEVLNHLYKIGGLNIISRTSSMAYKDSKRTSKEIANELGVESLLGGSVQKDGDHIRIIVQLINGKTNQYLWTETYDREFKDVFFIQSDIAQQIAAALKVKIDPGTKSRIEYIPTENTSAYNLYLQSKVKALNDNKSWKELLDKVVRLDSTFAPAYADLAVYWLSRGHYRGNLNAKQVLDSTLPLLKKAIQLDSNLSSAHEYLAIANLWFDWDFKAAEKEWEKFFQLNPSGLLWVENYVDFLSAKGRSFDALDFASKNRDHDKKDITNWTSLAMSYYYMNQPDKAQMVLDSAWLLLKDPLLFGYKAWVLVYRGKYEQVITNLNKNFEIFPDDYKIPRMKAWLAISYFHTSQTNKVQQIVDSLQFLSNKTPVGSPAFHLAMIYVATGRKDLALQWLEKAYIDHEVEMFWLKAEPLFRPLHNDPHFQNLLHKIGFPD